MTESRNRLATAVQPTLVDRVVGFFSPPAALNRIRARASLEMATSLFGGGYTGARTDRPSLRNWTPWAGSADADTLVDLPALRARSRDAVRNQPLASGAISTNVLNVVGTGLKPKSQLDRELLGLTDEEAQAWERRAERIFAHHSARIDVEGELSFAGLQALVFQAVLESGDVLPIRRFVERDGEILGTRIQIVEADRISNPRGIPALQQRGLAAGVEIDRDGRVLAYYVADGHPGDAFAGPLNWERVEVHGEAGRRAKLLFLKKRPGQRRGVPILAPVLERLKQISRLSEAELAASVLNAFFTVFIKHTGGDPADVGLNGFVGTGGVAENVDGAGYEAPERELHLGQGTVVDLMEGEEIESADPSRPNVKFDPFWVAMVREVGVAIDMPVEVLVKHFQSSYSASRAAFLMAWKSFLVHRSWLAGGLCRLAWEWTLDEAVARGLLEAPGYFDDPLVRDAWLAVEWTGDAPGEIDENKAVDAALKRIGSGISTLAEETIRLTGGDWERKHPQRAREARMRREAGLDVEPQAERVITESTAKQARDDDPDADDRAEEDET